MIRVIIERHPKEGKTSELMLRLRELRGAAIHQPGYITGETLADTEDASNITVLGTWRSLEEWMTWYKSESRKKLCQKVAPLLTKESKVSTFQIVATD
jgi:heme-degrading monooxygenase HmoA